MALIYSRCRDKHPAIPSHAISCGTEKRHAATVVLLCYGSRGYDVVWTMGLISAEAVVTCYLAAVTRDHVVVPSISYAVGHVPVTLSGFVSAAAGQPQAADAGKTFEFVIGNPGLISRIATCCSCHDPPSYPVLSPFLGAHYTTHETSSSR